MASSPRTPIRATWSSLQCLSELSPPSPTLSPGRFSTTLTSGEIPIFLDPGIRTSDATPASPGSTSHPRCHPTAEPYNGDFVALMLGPTTNADCEDLSIASSYETTCTFGLSRRLWSLPNSEHSPNMHTALEFRTVPLSTPLGPSTSSPSSFFSTNLSTHPIASATIVEYCASPPSPDTARSDKSFSITVQPCDQFHPLDDDEDTISISYALQGSGSHTSVSTYHTAKMSLPSSGSDGSFLSLDVDRNSLIDVSSTCSADEPPGSKAMTPAKSSSSLSTNSSGIMSFACPSPVLSASPTFFRPPSRTVGKERLARRNGIRQPSQTIRNIALHYDHSTNGQLSVRPNDIETDPAVSIILPRDTTTYITRPRSSSTSTTMSGHSYQSTQSNLSSSSSSRSWYANTDSLAAIPTHLSWLKNTVVELMVDQEGFRTAAAGFKLVGFTNVNGGIAHFLPIKRKAFYTFHHSLLDSDPVLYRIQVNGEEKRDYLTRQATLALKKPGVYTVSGTEALRSSPRVSTPPSEPAPDNFLSMTDATITPTIASGVGCDGKLEWLFTYCVEPCTNARGAVLDGERVLRPVSFACSPMLLHESQARKVGLLRLAAKLVQPKLAAQHIPPPAPPTSLRARAPLRPVDNIPLDVFPQAPLVWNDSHVRAHSQTSAESRTYDDARPLINRDGRLKAASLGEQRPPASQQLVDETTQRLEMLVMPDSQWILPGSPTKSSIAPRAPTAKLDMPSFKDFFEELSAFGFVKHKRTDSNVVPRNR